MLNFHLILILVSMLLFAGCKVPLNQPYPAGIVETNTLFLGFSQPPHNLDPVRSYRENEATFLYHIYEPPFQYHYLKRPYEVIPSTAQKLPEVIYLDTQGKVISGEVLPEEVQYSLYTIHLKNNILFQPHPAFAIEEPGKWTYWPIAESDLKNIDSPYALKHSQQDTRMLTASDYVYQIKRLSDPSLHSPIFSLMHQYIVGFDTLSQQLVQDRRKNPKEWLDLRKYSLEGVQALDPYQYQIKIKGYYPQFLYWMTMPFFAPVPWEVERFFAQKGMKEKSFSLDVWPVGTGAYWLAENQPNQKIVLKRNPNFRAEFYPSEGMAEDVSSGFLEDAGKKLPFIDQIVFSYEKEQLPYWQKFLQGYYDVSGISSDVFNQVVRLNKEGKSELSDSLKKKEILLKTEIFPSVFYLGFNFLDPIVGGRKEGALQQEKARNLRQAIFYAVNYEEYLDIFLNNRGEVAQSPIPPGIFGAQLQNKQVAEDISAQTRLEKAKNLLRQAGYPDGLSAKGKHLQLYLDIVGNSAALNAQMNWFVKQFEKISIQLIIRNLDINRFQQAMKNGQVQLFLSGWNADYPDPENFLFLLSSDQAKIKFGGENLSNYQNLVYDELFLKMRSLPNGPERFQVIKQMLDVLQSDQPWLWGVHQSSYTLHHAWLKNRKPGAMIRNGLKYQRIDVEMRQKRQRLWNQALLWPLFLSLFGVVLVLILIKFSSYFRKR